MKTLRCLVFFWHISNWWSLCDTILWFERSQFNQYQIRARFYSGRVYFFVYNNKVLGNKMVLDDRRLRVRKLADIVGISKSAVHRILTDNLDMKKLCATWFAHKGTKTASWGCFNRVFDDASQQQSRFFASIHNKLFV